MTGPDLALVAGVRRALEEAADPVRTPEMAAYMKSAMPFRGVPKPARVAALRPVWAAHPPTDRGVDSCTIRRTCCGGVPAT